MLKQALSLNAVKPDWQIICELGTRLGFPLKYGGPAKIFPERAKNIPLWAGLAPGGSVGKTGVPAQVSGQFVPYDLDVSLPGRRPFALIVGKALQHSGSYTTHEPCATPQVTPRADLSLNPEDAAALGLTAGDAAGGACLVAAIAIDHRDHRSRVEHEPLRGRR